MPRAATSVATRNSRPDLRNLFITRSRISLVHVAVQTVGRITLRVQVIHQVVHHAFGVAENDAELEVVDIDEPREQFDFVAAIDFVIDLLDRRHRQRLLLDAHLLRIARIFFDQLLDRTRNGGGEENGLAFFGRGLENQFDVIAETHVQHDIHFVEDDHLQRVRAAACRGACGP